MFELVINESIMKLQVIWFVVFVTEENLVTTNQPTRFFTLFLVFNPVTYFLIGLC